MDYTLEDAKKEIRQEIDRAKKDASDQFSSTRVWSQGELAGLKSALQYINQIKSWPPGWTPGAIKELIEAGKVILPNIDQPVPYEDYRRFQKALASLEEKL